MHLRTIFSTTLFLATSLFLQASAGNPLPKAPDSSDIARSINLNEVVVTGTRNATDIRHLPMTVSVISHRQIEESHEVSLLPLLSQQVPGLFVTSRGVYGYGVSDGAAGGISLRGIGAARPRKCWS